MDSVTIMRRLLRRRLALLAGYVLALLVCVLLSSRVSLGVPPSFQSRSYYVGLASASVLFDTEKSQVSDLGDPKLPAGSDSLGARSQLLANLVIASPLKERIAARAGVSSQRLYTKLSSSDPNVLIASPPTVGVNIPVSDRRASLLDLRINAEVPILTFNARAPTPEAAAGLANAAIVELQSYLEQTASTDAVPGFRKIVVEPLGQAQSSTERRGPTLLRAAIGALLAFALWCVGIIAFDVRRSRRAVADLPEEIDVPEELTPAPVPEAPQLVAPTEIPEPRRRGRVA